MWRVTIDYLEDDPQEREQRVMEFDARPYASFGEGFLRVGVDPASDDYDGERWEAQPGIASVVVVRERSQARSSLS